MYLDTCILAKLFVREPDSEACAARTMGAALVSSEVAYAEMLSALLKKERAGEISAAQRDSAWAEFERQLRDESVCLIPLDHAIVRKAKDVMLEVHPRAPLRTLDAIHLATYLSIVTGPFFTKDRQMQEAAKLLEIPLA
jgi:predicted nucleic acid-binding protein